MKAIILAMAVAVACSIAAHAQEREAPQLDPGDLGWTGTDFDSVTAFAERPWLWGWNWLSMDGDASATMSMNVWHLNDPFHNPDNPGVPNWVFGAQRTPGQHSMPTTR